MNNNKEKNVLASPPIPPIKMMCHRDHLVHNRASPLLLLSIVCSRTGKICPKNEDGIFFLVALPLGVGSNNHECSYHLSIMFGVSGDGNAYPVFPCLVSVGQLSVII
ncbi:hypothetical protein TNIN_329381 [Trichonephila inaurata madagascariensis]|uniref:Uncharacterized protein n=1 Tax=Trichonephila inaurata madagascariensis TaxID=2747483 RepID=A0A8X6X3V6_9ARAC|nr:hypothetical protein TNIN_329381 [Trichonephila inaurata madagascariensis]